MMPPQPIAAPHIPNPGAYQPPTATLDAPHGIFGGTSAPLAVKGSQKPAPATAAPAPAAPRLLTRVPSELNYGEHVIGSTHSDTFHTPYNLSPAPVVARFTLTGDDGFYLTSPPSITLLPSNQLDQHDSEALDAASPKIVFRPAKSGSFHAVLAVTLDGSNETQTVALHGRARSLDEAPSHEQTPAERAAEATEHARFAAASEANAKAMERDAKKGSVAYDDDFNKAMISAGNSAKSLAASQKAGLDIVDKEVAAYQKAVAKADRSVWWDIAELALTMATAGLAAHIAKNLLPKLLGTIVETTEELPIPGLPTMTTSAFAPAKLGEFWTDGIKEGLKMAGKAAIKEILPKSGTPATRGTGSAHQQQHSTNPTIDFFAEQADILKNQGENNDTMVLDQATQLRPLRRAHPEAATNVMKTTATTFVEAADTAEQAQANAVTSQWATFVARMKLGGDQVATGQDPDAKLSAVRTGSLRPHHFQGVVPPVDGVLDVYVENNGHTAARLTRAKLFGVSQSFADRIANLSLANAKMPIRLIINPGDGVPTIATRDEAGRVRITSDGNEPDAIDGATMLFEQSLNDSLAAREISIETDDANK